MDNKYWSWTTLITGAVAGAILGVIFVATNSTVNLFGGSK